MRRVLSAMAILLLTAAPVSAHGHFSFGINFGLPLFYPYGYPAYSYPQPYPYFYPERRIYYAPNNSTTVIEKHYVNGRLVEKRVKVYGDRYSDDRGLRYGNQYGYGPEY